MDLDKLTLSSSQKVEILKREIDSAKRRIETLKRVIKDDRCLAIPITATADPVPVISHDGNFRLISANQSLANYLGYEVSDFSAGDDVRKFFPDESEATFAAMKAAVLKTGMTEPFETCVKCNGGEFKTAIVGLVKSGPGDQDWLIYLYDISSRARLSRELTVKETNLRTLTMAIPQLLFVCDAEGQIIYANESFYRYSGLPPCDSQYIHWPSLLHPADQVSFSGIGFSVGELYADFQTEVRLLSGDGEYRWHLLKVVPFFNNDRATLNWLAIGTDIDDQRRVTEALMASEEQLRIIADAIPQIVWTADSQGTIDFWNHRWFEYTGLTPQQSLHGGWRLLIHSDDLSNYERTWRDCVESGQEFKVEFRLKRVLGLSARMRRLTAGANRDHLWHLCRAVPVKDEMGRVLRWFGTWTEIEEHKAPTD